ncbi:MAG TPA: TrkH family potassium uptake protein [Candidatus Scatomonas pullistercoris]|uniref:TrkH family potassium uptake protein n=1 Tax=Candidatus Scatomonas pullistercoris TaxID=2840920 RepID=A0A9D1P536_9FIRM|nr:TrkH family potassium uptake protein [Candidatus Scatomonas pullistercoris]
MNFPMIRYVLSWVLKVEGAILALPCLTAVIYGEREGLWYLFWMAVCLALGFAGTFRKPENTEIYQKDGFAAAALSWIVMSVFGAVPFMLTGEIPSFIDALFEIVSGFTTTGSSILSDVEALSHTSLFWRSFSHWIGGMGVLVFILMLIPVKNGSQMNLMRAESPGPSVSKFVPRVRNTAILLYKIYIMMTVLQIVLLMLAGMQCFDALCISFGSAGTGGFSVLNSGCATYTPLQQWIITVFVFLFGVNFSFYYLILCKKAGAAFGMQEVRAYVLIIAVSVAVITWNISGMYSSFSESLRESAFQVGSIITTTGYATTDFNLWPELSKYILVMLMFTGACAGSTGGGIKVSRILILLRTIRKELQSIAHPRSVSKIKMDGHPVDHETLRSINVFFITYAVIFAVSVLILSIDEFPFETNFTAVAATLNNIGPGLGDVGPMGNFGIYSPLSKAVMVFDMLAGRLELFPLLLLFCPSTWKKRG